MILKQIRGEKLAGARAQLSTSAIALMDQVIVSGMGFATSIIIGRESREMLGIYYLALSIVLFVRGIQESLVAAPYKVFCHRHTESSLRFYAGSAVVHHSVVTIVVIGLLGCFALMPVDNLLPAGFKRVLLGLSLVLPLILLRELLRQLSFAKLRFSGALAIDTCVACVQIAGLLWLASIHQLSVFRAFSVIGLACGAASLAWLLTSTQKLEFHKSSVQDHWRTNWEFGRWAVAAQLVGAVAPYIVPWILSILKDEAATGLFAACLTLVGASRVVTDAIFNLLTPKSAQAYHHGGLDALVSMLVRWGVMFALFMGVFTLLVYLFGERLLVTVYGDQYAGTTWPLTILAFALWMHTIGFTCGDGLFVLEKTRENFWADVLSTALTLGLSVPLVHYYGIIGASLSTFVALASGAIARFFILKRCLRQAVSSEPPQ